jgi:hypothetical protein
MERRLSWNSTLYKRLKRSKATGISRDRAWPRRSARLGPFVCVHETLNLQHIANIAVDAWCSAQTIDSSLSIQLSLSGLEPNARPLLNLGGPRIANNATLDQLDCFLVLPRHRHPGCSLVGPD